MKLNTIRRAAITGSAITTAIVMAAGPAAASVLYVVSGHDLEVTSVNGSDTITIGCQGGQAQVNGADQLPCTDLQHVRVTTEGGTDLVDLGTVDAASFPHLASPEVDTTDGSQADVINGSQLGDVVHADPTDTVLGNGGNDQIFRAASVGGGDGDDLIVDPLMDVKAGAGNDTIVDPGWGPVNGESGYDTVTLDWEPLDTDSDYSVTLDSNGFRAESPTDPPVHLTLVNIESYDVTLGPANQRFDWRAYPGSVTMRAGAGADVLAAGPGRDSIQAGDGDDTIDVRDGQPDTVDCGTGIDTVTADAGDTLVGCEHVARTAPQTGAVSGPGRVRHGHRATYRFSADAPQATYRCRIDRQPFRPCSATFVLRTRKLALGRHRLEVVAVVDGTADPTASVKRIRVVR